LTLGGLARPESLRRDVFAKVDLLAVLVAGMASFAIILNAVFFNLIG
jgi:hypothetical protein